MAIPYYKVAVDALINWNGLSNEEANKEIETQSFQELENQVHALESVKSAVLG